MSNTGYISDWQANGMLGEFFGFSHNVLRYTALFSNEPGVTEPYPDEFAGGDYSRQPSLWSIPASRSTSNTDQMTFDNLQAGLLKWIAVFNSEVGNEMMFAGQLTTPIVIPNSGRLIIAPNDIVITL